MKHLFLFIVFLNVVYFLWGAVGQKSQSTVARQTALHNEKGLERLTVISADKIKLISSKTSRQKEPLAQVTTSGYDCYTVGDFVNEGDAVNLVNQLDGLVNQVSVLPFVRQKNYWVMFPAGETWEESLDNVETIKSKGVTDFWLLPNGESKGAISLGLFATSNRATTRLKELKDMQVNATLVTRNKSSYSVKVKTNGDLGLVQSVLNKGKNNQKDSIRKISC
jgi:hypothetical protein